MRRQTNETRRDFNKRELREMRGAHRIMKYLLVRTRWPRFIVPRTRHLPLILRFLIEHMPARNNVTPAEIVVAFQKFSQNANQDDTTWMQRIRQEFGVLASIMCHNFGYTPADLKAASKTAYDLATGFRQSYVAYAREPGGFASDLANALDQPINFAISPPIIEYFAGAYNWQHTKPLYLDLPPGEGESKGTKVDLRGPGTNALARRSRSATVAYWFATNLGFPVSPALALM